LSDNHLERYGPNELVLSRLFHGIITIAEIGPLASDVRIPENGKSKAVLSPEDPSVDAIPVEAPDPREDLVRRVVSSSTFEKSPKLRAFLVYVCRCAIDMQRAAATEQQIGIHVFGRPAGYNPNEDNIVRSQARLLRLKLEHHFANEGKHEPVVIAIPKGRYLPTFERREEQTAAQPAPSLVEVQEPPRPKLSMRVLVVGAVVLGLVAVGFISLPWFRRFHASSSAKSGGSAVTAKASESGSGAPIGVVALPGEVRIASGRTGDPYVDVWGRRWEADQYYQGGVLNAGPAELFPPVPDPNLFRTLREGAATDSVVAQSTFRYDIPVPKGVYELRLYFADPIRNTMLAGGQEAQNIRHFQINVNGRRVLSGFDAIADAGPAPIDIRAFKNISPAQDGKVHLEFIPTPERPFVNAIELTPGVAGKIKPIRLSAHKLDFVDTDGTKWSGDTYYLGGRDASNTNSDVPSNVPELYAAERYGNFSYSIPVPPGNYTLKLHFMESFFGPQVQSDLCRGNGCRVFDVACNGSLLLKDFDVYQAAGGSFRPVVRTFHHLHPNGQGKLFLTFSPTVNYAEVRAIEVIDEGQ